MELSIARNQDLPPEKRNLPDPLRKAPLDFYVRQLLGEIEGEHINKMEWSKEEKRWQWSQGQFFLDNILSRMLEQCRGVFDEKQLGYTTWNLLTIWKEQRSELSGIDLRRLNFQSFSFNGLRACRPGLRSSLSQRGLREENLFPQGHSSEVLSVAYNPDGCRILTGSLDNRAKVWDAQSGQCLLTLQGHSDWVRSVVYSPDGGRIVSGAGGVGSDDGTVKVWDAQTGQCLLTLQGHSSWVMSVAYSPDGGRILTGSVDGTAKIWDAQKGQCLLTLPNIPGLFIQGCDFRDLHPDSELSEDSMALLRQYSGIFDDEDARRWVSLCQKHGIPLPPEEDSSGGR
ncbi:MAG: WD40 repeat domain-containing protein [Lewinellaceae bacterium]|nr:WD40 repeat domain-containing protein [Lewinellaceae bacterium]